MSRAQNSKSSRSRVFQSILLAVLFIAFLSLTAFFTYLAIAARKDAEVPKETNPTSAENPFGSPGEYVSEPFAEEIFVPELKTIFEEPSPEPTADPTPVPTPLRINDTPDSGTVFSRKYSDKCCTLHVYNNLCTDCVVEMIHDRTGGTALSFFIRAYDAIDIITASGTYSFIIKTGEPWISEEVYFGSHTDTFTAASGVTIPWGEEASLYIDRQQD